jgi:hypothetical protein
VKSLTKHISSLPPLKPVQVTNLLTGEIVSNWVTKMDSLTTFVQEHAKRLISEHDKALTELFLSTPKKLNPAELARQNNIRVPISLFPTEVKAKSRVEKLIQHKVISEYSSFALNPNPLKQAPTINKTINLGAIDKQMATLEFDGVTLYLQAKIWDTEYLFEFVLPLYIVQRDIKKFSFPRVQYNKKGEIVFYFTIGENITHRSTGKLNAGIDLGITQQYSLAVTNKDGARVAHYNPSGRLNQLSKKFHNLKTERSHLYAKIDAYSKLGIDNEALVIEAKRKGNKITRVNFALSQQTSAEITKKLVKHSVIILNMENLSWVSTKKGSSRWNHSQQQDNITHAVARHGIRTKRVNPKNTSQYCHKCGGIVTHNTRTRVATCSNCKANFDRDFNAAMNISNNINASPFLRGSTGVTVVPQQVTVLNAPSNVTIVLTKLKQIN